MKATDRKPNPYARHGRINFRLNNEEMQTVVTKALVSHKGDISKFAREAVLNYKPVKKTKVSK